MKMVCAEGTNSGNSNSLVSSMFDFPLVWNVLGSSPYERMSSRLVHWKLSSNKSVPSLEQGRNEVCFFIADPISVRNFLILDSKSVANFRP